MSSIKAQSQAPTQKTTDDPLLLPPIYIVIPSLDIVPCLGDPKIFSSSDVLEIFLVQDYAERSI